MRQQQQQQQSTTLDKAQSLLSSDIRPREDAHLRAMVTIDHCINNCTMFILSCLLGILGGAI